MFQGNKYESDVCFQKINMQMMFFPKSLNESGVFFCKIILQMRYVSEI